MAKAVDELKRIVRGAARRAVPVVEHVAGIAPPVNAAPPVRPRPVPDGTTESELEAVMSTIRVDDGPEAELAGYMNESYWRFLHTWGLVAGESGRALELGSNPYFTTWLLRHHTDLDLTLANYFGSDEREITQTVGYRDREGASQSFEIRADLFDLETERFPYDDGSFDVVLFCEIIEHLIADPMHALSEIHRVLRPGGLMVITTPNVARLDNVLRLIDGENVFDPYSFYGPHGRHNREYTRHELVHLLRFAGFDDETSFTADANPHAETTRSGYEQLLPALRWRIEDLGQYLFVAARKTGPVGEGLPSFLYRSYPADRTMVDVFSR
jgi:SAM-dependent methyltransferase